MAKRWYYTFKTFQGHTCEVDICDETFTGTATELNKDVANSPGCPSDNPVQIDEDNSDDLLEAVRMKTGYLNFVELIQNGLKDLFPLTNNQFEVLIFMDKPSNVSYDDAGADAYMIFHGYVQAQSFKSEYMHHRNIVKLPIQSVLNVIGDQKIGTQETMLRKIFATDFTEYKYIVFPEAEYKIHPDTSEDPIDIIEASFMKSALFPYNSDYNHGVAEYGETPSVYNPMTKMEFVEALCSSLGLLVHEVGNMLVFVGQPNAPHRKYLVSELGTNNYTYEVITGSTNYIGSFDYASNKNKQSYVLPLDKLTSEWKKPEVPAKINFSICKYSEMTTSYMALQYTGNQIASTIWNNSTAAVANSIRLLGYADESQEVFEIRSNQSHLALFSLNFEVAYLHYRPAFVNNLHMELYGSTRTGWLEIAVFSNGKWYNFDFDPEQGEEEWVDSAIYKTLTVSGNTIDQKIAVNGKTCTIYFRNGSTTSLLYQVKSIELDYIASFKKFQLAPDNISNKIVRTFNTGTLIERNVDINLWYYCDGYFSYADANNYGESQRNLTLYLRKKTAISELSLLLGNFGVATRDTLNRVVSTRHNVREDIYELQIIKKTL